MLIIHKASAGSGKTFSLTYQYIRLLLAEKKEDGSYRLSQRHNRHRAILAITFTNKATDEMKGRIVKQLAILAGAPSAGNEKSPYLDMLIKDIGCSAEEIKGKSATALKELLCDFTNFNVSTIDSFFQTVLRTFAREANLSGNYEVELDQGYALMLGINRMLSTINRTSNRQLESQPHIRHLIMWLKSYINAQIKSGNSFNIFNRKSNVVASLNSFVDSVLSETYRLNSTEIDAYFDNIENIVRFSQKLAEVSDKVVRNFTDYARSVVPVILGGFVSGRFSANVGKVLDRWVAGEFHITPTMVKNRDNIDKLVNKGTEMTPEAEALMSEAIGKAVSTTELLATYDYIKKNIYYLGLISEIKRCAIEEQNDNNSIILSDTSDILRRIINQEEAPFIYERLGVRLRHFLIDEFQDTSRLQWENMSALIKESLATDNDNLLIGDEKQSIYRFRNSDPSLIIKDVPEEFSEVSSIRGTTPEENANWRSSSEVVTFNNTIFSYMASMLDITDIYSNVLQNVANKKEKGYVKAYSYSEPEESWDIMVEEIKRELASGYRMEDIAVLVNTNDQGTAIIDYLLSKKDTDPALSQLRVMSEDALTISAAPSVKMIVSVMRYLDEYDSIGTKEETDENSLRDMARINARFHYYFAREGEHLEAIRKALEGDGTPEEMAREARDMVCVSLPSLVERIAVRYLNDEQRSSDNVFINGFQDLVLDFVTGNSDADLHSFLKWWDEAGARKKLNTPGEVSAIRVMTIHKSKGLEFPCVHIPLLDWQFNKGKSITWYDTRDGEGNYLPPFSPDLFEEGTVPPFIPLRSAQVLDSTPFAPQYRTELRKELVDQINKAYVGFTRAVNELVIGYKYSESENVTTIQEAFAETIENVTHKYCESFPDISHLFVSLADKVDEEGVLEVGQPTVCEKERTRKTSLTIPPYYSYDNDSLWEMSRIDEIEDMELPRQRGIILHRVMNDIIHRGDVRKAVLRRAMKGFIDAEDVESITEQLEEALSDERVGKWFDGFEKVITERSIIVRKNDVTDQYRPDRVVWTADGGIDVVDFKFGAEEPSSYFSQVRNYVRLVKAAFPDKVVRGYLWYPLRRHISMV